MALDVFFLSHNEVNAENNWQKLKELVPTARRVDGVDGLINAHKECARKSRTKNLYIIDADVEILPAFDYTWKPPEHQQTHVHVWHTYNPVNGLVYGYSGVKLFPKRQLLDVNTDRIDLCTSVSDIHVHDDITGIARFNTSPFNAFRSAFRECAKLATIFKANEQCKHLLDVWCSVGEGDYGDYSILGAQEGRNFGCQNSENADELKKINDPKFIQECFDNKVTI